MSDFLVLAVGWLLVLVIFLGFLSLRRYLDHRERMAMKGVEIVVPDADERRIVNDVIYDELVLGVVREESRAQYRKIIECLAQAGAEGVILGCTEIELLISQADSPMPVFASTALHTRAAVDFSLGG